MSEEKGLKKLSPKLRITLLAALIIFAVAGIIYGVLVYIRSGSSVVNVYSVEYFTMNGANNKSETQGPVQADRIQSVMVSKTQIVKEVFVSEGDSVKQGDPLLSFDTTLSDIELERQEIKIGQLELELKQAEANLKEINTYRVGSPVTVDPVSPTQTDKDLEYLDTKPRKGDGTEASPYVIMWSGTRSLDYNIVDTTTKWTIKTTDEGGSIEEKVSDTIYVVFETRENNSLGGSVINNYMVVFFYTDEKFSFRVTSPSGDYSPDNPEQSETTTDTTHYVSTLAELQEMKDTAQNKIDTLKLDLKKAQLKHSELEYELTNGVVYSKLDGIVKTVNDPEAVSGTDEPALVVSGGGGYFVTGAMSEDELDSMHVGDIVSIMSWESYQNGEAVITSISEYPADSSNGNLYHYSSGNNNSSLYSFTAAIGEDMNVREGEYLNITYSPKSKQSSGIYIESMFIRKENGQSYVYVEGADGRLERRNIKTGGTLYGSYTEILSGVSIEDHIAFPYGRKVKAGAKTVRASSDMLYIG